MLKVGTDRRVPMMRIYSLFRGQAKPEDVLDAVRQGEPKEAERKQRLFYAHLYLGLYFEIQGDKKKALEHLTAADNLKIGGYMHDVARVHRALLEKLQTTPAKSPKEENQTRTDRYGDPLPEGALQLSAARSK